MSKKQKVAVPGLVTPPEINQDTIDALKNDNPEKAAEIAAQSQDTAEALVNFESQLDPDDRDPTNIWQDPKFCHLVDRIEALEQLVVRMAHNSGTSHSVIIKAGLKPYNPTKDDMSKVRTVAVS